MYGREVRLCIDIMFGAPEDTPSSVRTQYAHELVSNLDEAYNDVREHLQDDHNITQHLDDSKGPLPWTV